MVSSVVGSISTSSRRDSLHSTGSIPPLPRTLFSSVLMSILILINHLFHPNIVLLLIFPVSGDLIYTLRELGSTIVRFDANSVLATERIAPQSTEARGTFHPLSAVSTQVLAMSARKLGGFSYEENGANMELQYVIWFE